MAEDNELEKRAIEELLRETDRARVRAETMGPAGWLKCPLRSTNKRFLLNTLRSTGLQRRTGDPRGGHSTTRGRLRSESPERSRGRSRSPSRDHRSNGSHTDNRHHHRDNSTNRHKKHSRDKDRSHRHKDNTDEKHRKDGHATNRDKHKWRPVALLFQRSFLNCTNQPNASQSPWQCVLHSWYVRWHGRDFNSFYFFIPSNKNGLVWSHRNKVENIQPFKLFYRSLKQIVV